MLLPALGGDGAVMFYVVCPVSIRSASCFCNIYGVSSALWDRDELVRFGVKRST